MSKPEDRTMEVSQPEEQKEKDGKKVNRDKWTHRTLSRGPTYALWEAQKDKTEKKEQREYLNNG